MTTPEYKTPLFVPIFDDPDDRDRDMFAVPRWVLAVLAGELAARGECDGSEHGCVRCDAIRVAREASEHGEASS